MKSHLHRLRNQLRISVVDVRLGMFVAELDRPWVETPFMMQGFVLTDPAHLEMLRDFVRTVMIDPVRSTTDSLRHLPWDALHEPVAEVRAPHTAVVHGHAVHAVSSDPHHDSLFTILRQRLRNALTPGSQQDAAHQSIPYFLRYGGQASSDQPSAEGREPVSAIARKADLVSKLTPPSTRQFSEFIESIYPHDAHFVPLGIKDRILIWWGRRGSRMVTRRAQAAVSRPPNDRPDFIPDTIPLVIYRDQVAIEEETVRAKAVVQQAGVALEKIVKDIQSDLPICIDGVQPVVDVLVESVISNPNALMWSVRMHDQSKKTYLHGLRVAIYMMTLGRHLGFPKEQLSELGNIGLLLDIGMLKLPEALLEKAGELTADEDELLTLHVTFSMETLEQGGPLPENVARGIREHHERIDGSGYPHGLAGESISIYGRMAAIADSFSAMTTARPYDVTHSAFDALKELFKEAETRLHAPLVEQFVQAISIFPVGSLIELSSGEVAIVLEHNRVRRLEPLVLVLTDMDKELLALPFKLDLMGRNKSNSDRMQILRGLPDGAYDINYRDYYL